MRGIMIRLKKKIIWRKKVSKRDMKYKQKVSEKDIKGKASDQKYKDKI